MDLLHGLLPPLLLLGDDDPELVLGVVHQHPFRLVHRRQQARHHHHLLHQHHHRKLNHQLHPHYHHPHLLPMVMCPTHQLEGLVGHAAWT